MASQEFLASFAVEIDEGGVTRLQSILEENRALAEQFVIKDAKLSERYKGLDAAEQAALDKELKYEYVVEKYGK